MSIQTTDRIIEILCGLESYEPGPVGEFSAMRCQNRATASGVEVFLVRVDPRGRTMADTTHDTEMDSDEEAEERADLAAVREALAEQGDEPYESWEAVKARLGL